MTARRAAIMILRTQSGMIPLVFQDFDRLPIPTDASRVRRHRFAYIINSLTKWLTSLHQPGPSPAPRRILGAGDQNRCTAARAEFTERYQRRKLSFDFTGKKSAHSVIQNCLPSSRYPFRSPTSRHDSAGGLIPLCRTDRVHYRTANCRYSGGVSDWQGGTSQTVFGKGRPLFRYGRA